MKDVNNIRPIRLIDYTAVYRDFKRLGLEIEATIHYGIM